MLVWHATNNDEEESNKERKSEIVEGKSVNILVTIQKL